MTKIHTHNTGSMKFWFFSHKISKLRTEHITLYTTPVGNDNIFGSRNSAVLVAIELVINLG